MRYISLLIPALFAFVFVTGCSDDSAVDSVLPSAPSIIKEMRLSCMVFDTDTIQSEAGREKTISDPIKLPLQVLIKVADGAPASLALRVCVYQLSSGTALFVDTLTKVDAVTYSSSLMIGIKRGDVGDYRVEVTGVAGQESIVNSAVSKFTVIYGTKPPVLLSVSAPDTLVLSSTETQVFSVSVAVTDSSGLADIRMVFFNSFLPSNAASSGNPFMMYDDGTHGDVTAGDGIYTLTIQLTPAAAKGRYRFEFQAVDYSGLSSNILKHNIYVI